MRMKHKERVARTVSRWWASFLTTDDEARRFEDALTNIILWNYSKDPDVEFEGFIHIDYDLDRYLNQAVENAGLDKSQILELLPIKTRLWHSETRGVQVVQGYGAPIKDLPLIDE